MFPSKILGPDQIHLLQSSRSCDLTNGAGSLRRHRQLLEREQASAGAEGGCAELGGQDLSPSLQADGREEVVVSAGYCPQTGEWVGRGWASPWTMFGILLYGCDCKASHRTEITVLLYSGF